MATVKITYHGMEGEGRNVTEAKRSAGHKIEQALYGSYAPRIVRYKSAAILLWRSPEGWHSTSIGDQSEHVGYSSPEGDYLEALAKATFWACQLGWEHSDGFTTPLILTGRERDDFRRWVRFQLLYRAASNRGKTDHECHTIACGCLGRPDLVEVYRECEAEVNALERNAA